jgi:sulfur carrier protein
MSSEQTSTIEIVVNGAARQVPDGLAVRELLEHIQVDPSRVAVELNREIVRKTDWEAVRVHAGAELEIVQFVGGG